MRKFLPLLLALPLAVLADEFRSFNPIPTPAAAAAVPGALPVARPVPVDPRLVEAAVRKLLAAWNTPGFAEQLGVSFYDRARLLDAMDDKAPRDAVLRIIAIRGIHTVAQYRQPGEEGESLVSIVTAVVETQIEYNDPATGLQRHPGVNELTFRVTQ